MTYTVTITKQLEDWWGIDKLIKENGNDLDASLFHIVNLLLEDTPALLDGATFEISKATWHDDSQKAIE